MFDAFQAHAFWQQSRTMNLYPVIEDEYSEWGLDDIRAMQDAIGRHFGQTGSRNFQFSLTVEILLHLFVAKIPGQERHDVLIQMYRIAIGFIATLVTELSAAYAVPDKTDTSYSKSR